VDSKYKVGDLVILNEFGRLVIDDNQNRVALVIAGPNNMLYSLGTALMIPEQPFNYWAYDIMIGNELITDVPQDFLERMIKGNESGVTK